MALGAGLGLGLGIAACGQHAARLVPAAMPPNRVLPMTAMPLPRSPPVVPSIQRMTRVAERRYAYEEHGALVRELLRRVAADPGVRAAVRAHSTPELRAAVRRRFASVWYHWHVSRLLIVRGGRTVVDVGVPFVVAPSSRPLRDAAGATVATLRVSDQDVIGFVRFMHRNHDVDVVARGVGAAHVRTSLPAAAHVALPARGETTIAGQRYRVGSFTRPALGGEPVRIWILQRA